MLMLSFTGLTQTKSSVENVEREINCQFYSIYLHNSSKN
jgi:hypothetical protein